MQEQKVLHKIWYRNNLTIIEVSPSFEIYRYDSSR